MLENSPARHWWEEGPAPTAETGKGNFPIPQLLATRHKHMAWNQPVGVLFWFVCFFGFFVCFGVFSAIIFRAVMWNLSFSEQGLNLTVKALSPNHWITRDLASWVLKRKAVIRVEKRRSDFGRPRVLQGFQGGPRVCMAVPGQQ